MFLDRHPFATMFVVAVALALTIGMSSIARATPSFARQTGFSCTQCHTQFPELTPFGRAFKAGGYSMTLTKSIQEQKHEHPILDILAAAPLGIMAQVGYTHTNSAESPAKNDDVQFPQQISFFYAGKIAPGAGAFMQLTYSGVDNHFSMDNTDIRFSHTTSIKDTGLIFGLTLNNNPTVEDLWNTTPAWGFPWTSSPVGRSPGAQPLIAGALAQQVAGLGAYAFWDNMIYAQLAIYHAAPLGTARPLGTPNGANSTDAANVVAGVAPYWRVTFEKDLEKQSFSLGTFGMMANIYPGANLAASPNGTGTLLNGPTDHFVDTAIDAQYQYIGEQHIASVFATWIHENNFLNATSAAGLAGQSWHTLDTFRLTGGYIYDHLIGAHVSYFSTNGTGDSTLYAPGALSGSRTGGPFSNGLMSELSVTPWVNTKFVVQYTSYFSFNGANSNYDGSGRDASANNTLYILAWLTY